MVDQQREQQRYDVSDSIDVYDSQKDCYLGRLVNIHDRGLMLMGDQPLEEDKLYTLDLHLPFSLRGRDSIHIGVDCLWTRNADHNAKHWSGFTIIDISPEARVAIHELIEKLS